MKANEANPNTIENESISVLTLLKNSLRRLAMKFGYIKKPDPHPDVVHDFQDENADLYHEYHCMSPDDQPILINGVPVTVSKPEDCQKFFTQSKAEGVVSVMEPPVEFILVARNLFKSNPRLTFVSLLSPLKTPESLMYKHDLCSCMTCFTKESEDIES